MRGWTVTGTLFAVIWVFVRGADLTIEGIVGELLVGLVVGLPVAYLFRRLYDDTQSVRQSLTVIPSVILYVVVFVKEVIVANFDVAKRVLAPRGPLRPQVILVPLRVETDLGVTTIANSITLTPGTVTLDHDHERNALYVHIIDGRRPKQVVDPIRRWEDYALAIFDEEATPETPAEAITIHPPEKREPPEPSRAPLRPEKFEEVVTEPAESEGGESDGE